MVFRSNDAIAPTNTGIARLEPIFSRFRGLVAFWVGKPAKTRVARQICVRIAPRAAHVRQVVLRSDPTRGMPIHFIRGLGSALYKVPLSRSLQICSN